MNYRGICIDDCVKVVEQASKYSCRLIVLLPKRRGVPRTQLADSPGNINPTLLESPVT